MPDENVKQLARTLLTHRWDVEIVEREDGVYGAALLLDGWYQADTADNDPGATAAYWQGVVDRLCDAADVRAKHGPGDWYGTVAKK